MNTPTVTFEVNFLQQSWCFHRLPSNEQNEKLYWWKTDCHCAEIQSADFWLSCPWNGPSYPECAIGQWFQKGYRHQRRNFEAEYRQQLFKSKRIRLFDHMRENMAALRDICRILCAASTETQALWKATVRSIFLNTESTAKAVEICIQFHSFIQETCRKQRKHFLVGSVIWL